METAPPSYQPPVQPTSATPPPSLPEHRSKMPMFIALAFIVALLLGGGAYYLAQQSKQKQVPLEQSSDRMVQYEETEMIPQTSPQPDIDFNSTYQFDLPEGYVLQSSSPDHTAYGADGSEYLRISRNQMMDPSELTPCSQRNSEEFCLADGKNWGQGGDIVETSIAGVPAQSFYIAGSGPDNAFHIVQTTQAPNIQLKMYVAGGGLDQTFASILSSFTFVTP